MDVAGVAGVAAVACYMQHFCAQKGTKSPKNGHSEFRVALLRVSMQHAIAVNVAS